LPEPLYDIVLKRHRRGTEFKYSTTLENGWTGAMFTGGLLFTIRRSLPSSDILDDSDTIANGGRMLHQSSVANGELVFTSPDELTVLIPGAITHGWPASKLFWDLQGKVTAGERVLDVAAGTVIVMADITRTP